MEIKYICTYWGQAHLTVNEFVAKAIEAGFDGIEMNVPHDPQKISSVVQSVEQYKVALIAQQWLPPADETADHYGSRMNKQLNFLAELNPLFINSHTGKDYFSFEENCRLIESCQDTEKLTGIRIIHETHRGRFPFHAQSLLPYIQKYPHLGLTADFSHLCNVSESLLEDQEDTVARIISRSRYIHARVGSDQSAQVNHPFAPEWETALHRFTGWWQQIIDSAKGRQEEVFYICPEFGPAPYISALPFTRKPLADQWDINVKMMEYLKKNLS